MLIGRLMVFRRSAHGRRNTLGPGAAENRVGVSGQMQLLHEGKKMSIEATQGALQGGRWWFELTPVAPEATLVTGWARFDLDNTTWLLEKLVSADAYLGHGMIGASELMLMRAVRSRASK